MGRSNEHKFFQRGNANGQQAHEKMLNITKVKTMQVKTIPGEIYHLTSARMAIIKKKKKVNWYSHCGKQYGSFSKY